MPRPTESGIVALVYHAGTDPGPVLRDLATGIAGMGMKCAGFVQRNLDKPGRSRCDMILEDVSSGRAIPISEDRGPGARGCRLDESELARAMMATMEALASGPDVLFINKFGKSESEGRGFRPLIGEAIERGVPVLIAVPWSNIDSWRQFAGEFASEFAVDGTASLHNAICEHLGLCARPAIRTHDAASAGLEP